MPRSPAPTLRRTEGREPSPTADGARQPGAAPAWPSKSFSRTSSIRSASGLRKPFAGGNEGPGKVVRDDRLGTVGRTGLNRTRRSGDVCPDGALPDGGAAAALMVGDSFGCAPPATGVCERRLAEEEIVRGHAGAKNPPPGASLLQLWPGSHKFMDDDNASSFHYFPRPQAGAGGGGERPSDGEATLLACDSESLAEMMIDATAFLSSVASSSCFKPSPAVPAAQAGPVESPASYLQQLQLYSKEPESYATQTQRRQREPFSGSRTVRRQGTVLHESDDDNSSADFRTYRQPAPDGLSRIRTGLGSSSSSDGSATALKKLQQITARTSQHGSPVSPRYSRVSDSHVSSRDPTTLNSCRAPSSRYRSLLSSRKTTTLASSRNPPSSTLLSSSSGPRDESASGSGSGSTTSSSSYAAPTPPRGPMKSPLGTDVVPRLQTLSSPRAQAALTRFEGHVVLEAIVKGPQGIRQLPEFTLTLREVEKNRYVLGLSRRKRFKIYVLERLELVDCGRTCLDLAKQLCDEDETSRGQWSTMEPIETLQTSGRLCVCHFSGHSMPVILVFDTVDDRIDFVELLSLMVERSLKRLKETACDAESGTLAPITNVQFIL